MDDLIEMNCPRCNAPIAFSPSDAGARGACPDCDAHFIIPSFASGSQTIHKVSSASKLYSPSNPKEYRNFAWRRWSARIIDSLIGFLMFAAPLIALRLICSHLGLRFFVSLFDIVFLSISVSLFLNGFLISTLLYALCGTTPGKKICGLVVCDSSGNLPSLKQFFLREMLVWLKGLWLAIPPLAFIPLFIQYRRCSKGRLTSYDENHAFQCHPVRSKSWFDLVIVIMLFACVYLFQNFATSALSYFQPVEINSDDTLSELRQLNKSETNQLFINDVDFGGGYHGFSIYNNLSNVTIHSVGVTHYYNDSDSIKHVECFFCKAEIPPDSVSKCPFAIFRFGNEICRWEINFANGVDSK